jgi:hypothetical protein
MDGPAPSDTKPTPPTPQAAADPGATPKTDAKHADATPAGRPSHNVPDTKPAVAVAAPQPTAAPPAHPGMVAEAAHVGMGEKGRGYGNGYIAVVAASYWSTRERLGLMQIQHDMDLFKANNDGKGPKTHEEFMEKIIKDGAIKLPELPAGQKYQYDPSTETLMVLKPEDPNGP